MKKMILLRFGDLVLKGKNKQAFIKQVRNLLKEKLFGLSVDFDFQFDRTYLILNENNSDEVLKQLQYVSGLQSYSFVYKTESKIDEIVKLASEVINKEITPPATFKIETKRADKLFPLTSQELTQVVAPLILKNTKGLTVDVKKPQFCLSIEVRQDATYMFLDRHKAMGGFPVGIGGKGMLMISGGIDSPVAAYLAIKQGVYVELLHFESTPLTPLESVQKVIDLSQKIALFLPRSEVRLHLVPFLNIHEKILSKVDDPYIITIMRRFMYKIAEEFANIRNCQCIINGESIGQVASQTLQSMKVIEAVTKIPILRPLATFDKQDIIDIAKRIDTFDVSIRPFNDCCSIYVPKNPTTMPKESKCELEESKLDVDVLINEAIKNIQSLWIKSDAHIDLMSLGFDVSEALKKLSEGNKDD